LRLIIVEYAFRKDETNTEKDPVNTEKQWLTFTIRGKDRKPLPQR